MRKIYIIIFLFSFSLAQNDFETWLKEQQSERNAMIEEENEFLASVTSELDNYINEQERIFQAFKSEVEKKWNKFRSSTPKEYVDYDDDLNARGTIDFEKGEIEIEILIDDDPNIRMKDKESSAKIKLQEKLSRLVVKGADDNQSILKDQLTTNSGHKVTKDNALKFSKEIVNKQKLSIRRIQSNDGSKRIKYVVRTKMLPNHLEIRANRFKSEILKQSERFKIDPAITFAIMHTESNFNPKARSYVPAYGLMQLVPKSGARDAYNYVYNKDKLLTGKYLYIPSNNIELGCAYISKIRYVYFKDINNDKSAYYCTISAYNTGPGNVAKTISGSSKLKQTSKIVNGKTANEIYKILSRKLPYKETRNYLKKVTSRINDYSI